MMKTSFRRRLMVSASAVAAMAVTQLPIPVANANDTLIELSKSNENWVMPGRTYNADNYSPMTQINTKNVKQLRVAWSFSDGVLNGHEGAPLVVNGKMFVNGPFPNRTFAFNLDDPGKIIWENNPKQSASARAVACCDVVNRGLAYWPGDGETPALLFKNQLDGHLVAMNVETGETIWMIENADIKVGATETQAPYVVKDEVITGSSGAELGVRGYVTAYDVRRGIIIRTSTLMILTNKSF